MNTLTVVAVIIYFLPFSTVNCKITIRPPSTLLHPTKSQNNVPVEVSQQRLQSDLKKFVKDINDTIYIEHVKFDFVHPAIRGRGTLDQLYISNLTKFDLCLMVIPSFPVISIDLFTLTFRDIFIQGKYDLLGNIGELFDIWGQGKFWVSVIDFKVSLRLGNFTGGLPICIDTSLNVDVGEMKNRLDNFMDDPELGDLLNDLLTDIGPELIEILWEESKETTEKYVENVISDILHNENYINLFNGESKKSRELAIFCYSSEDLLNP